MRWFFILLVPTHCSTRLRLEPHGIKFKILSETGSLQLLPRWTSAANVSGLPAIDTPPATERWVRGRTLRYGHAVGHVVEVEHVDAVDAFRIVLLFVCHGGGPAVGAALCVGPGCGGRGCSCGCGCGGGRGRWSVAAADRAPTLLGLAALADSAMRRRLPRTCILLRISSAARRPA